MISPMIRWFKRGWPFTLLAALMFTAGCAGGYSEPATAADYAYEEEAQPAQASYSAEQADPAQQSAAVTTADYEDTDPSALTEFKSELDPYGVWVNDPTYGMVWVPRRELVGADFAPYVTGGHWAMTADGDWIWESEYPFGWVTFHYGRWVWIPGYGWSWIAGRRYANAWVVWRTPYDGYDYIGWAPMPPYYYWSGGVAVSFWLIPPAPYVFCHSHYVFSPHWHSHVVHGSQVAEAAHRTRPYTPATPSTGSGAGSSGGHRFATPSRGPTLDAAHIPPSAAPKSWASPNARAVASAHPRSVSAASTHALVRPPSARSAVPGRPAPAVSRPVYRGAPSAYGPAYSASRAQPAYRSPGSPPAYRSSPYYGPTQAARPSATPAYRPSYSTPSYRGSSPSYGSPSYRSSSPSYGSPSYRSSSPSFGSPSYRSPSYSRPSYSAPSTPSYRPHSSGGYSGGGRSVGRSGGGFRGGSVGRGGRR